MSDTDKESFVPYATPREKYLNGMLKGHKLSRKNVEIGYVASRKRSAFAAKDFNAGDFVCEYPAIVREKRKGQLDTREERNAELGIDCYCLDANYRGVTYTFDAASKCNNPGRFEHY